MTISHWKHFKTAVKHSNFWDTPEDLNRSSSILFDGSYCILEGHDPRRKTMPLKEVAYFGGKDKPLCEVTALLRTLKDP